MAGDIWPVKLLNERFKNSRPIRGGKSKGKEPVISLFETSRYRKKRRFEMGFGFPEILQLEMSRCCSLDKLVKPEGKSLRSLYEISRTVRFGKGGKRAKLVKRLEERLRT